jgi:hypothetical protein
MPWISGTTEKGLGELDTAIWFSGSLRSMVLGNCLIRKVIKHKEMGEIAKVNMKARTFLKLGEGEGEAHPGALEVTVKMSRLSHPAWHSFPEPRAYRPSLVTTQCFGLPVV